MTAPAHDPLLEERRTRAVYLHVPVVIALQRKKVQVFKAIIQMCRHVPQVRCISNALSKPLEHEAVRSRLIVVQTDWLRPQVRDRLKRLAPKRLQQLRQFRPPRNPQQFLHAVRVTENSDPMLEKRCHPGWAEMIAIQVGKTNGGNFANA